MGQTVSAFSWQGTKSRINEDSINWSAHTFAISDGMGGKPNGKKAADLATRLAIEHCELALENAEPIDNQLPAIFETIHVALCDSVSGSGCTLNVAVFQEANFYFCNVGDTRTYVYDGGNWQQVSLDQNLAHQTGFSLHRHLLTNHLGCIEFLPPQVTRVPISSLSVIAMMTDGLYETMGDNEICEFPVNSLSARLHDLARERSPQDDCSALIIDTRIQSNILPSMLSGQSAG